MIVILWKFLIYRNAFVLSNMPPMCGLRFHTVQFCSILIHCVVHWFPVCKSCSQQGKTINWDTSLLSYSRWRYVILWTMVKLIQIENVIVILFKVCQKWFWHYHMKWLYMVCTVLVFTTFFSVTVSEINSAARAKIPRNVMLKKQTTLPPVQPNKGRLTNSNCPKSYTRARR